MIQCWHPQLQSVIRSHKVLLPAHVRYLFLQGVFVSFSPSFSSFSLLSSSYLALLLLLLLLSRFIEDHIYLIKFLQRSREKTPVCLKLFNFSSIFREISLINLKIHVSEFHWKLYSFLDQWKNCYHILVYKP